MIHNRDVEKRDRWLLNVSRVVIWLTWAVLLGMAVFVAYLLAHYHV